VDSGASLSRLKIRFADQCTSGQQGNFPKTLDSEAGNAFLAMVPSTDEDPRIRVERESDNGLSGDINMYRGPIFPPLTYTAFRTSTDFFLIWYMIHSLKQ
jgi:hypothetical protein